MIVSRLQLIDRLASASVPTWGAHLNGDRFATVSREWVAAVWDATMRELQANAPRLVFARPLGGGKSVLAPRYVLNGFNCRGHHLKVYSHGLTGFADQGAAAALAGTPLDYDALAWGLLEYTAQPRAENYQRSGRHEHLWFVDHAGDFQTFEAGDGVENELTAAELASITYLYAQ